VRTEFSGLLGAMSRHRALAADLEPAVVHFLKVTGSYWPHLFATYDVSDLPRTNNDLESLFGSVKHLERRITGRKRSSASFVIRGPVRLVASIATRRRSFGPKQLRPRSISQWKSVRDSLLSRRDTRRRQFRFRRDPQAFLTQLEQLAFKSVLPS